MKVGTFERSTEGTLVSLMVDKAIFGRKQLGAVNGESGNKI